MNSFAVVGLGRYGSRIALELAAQGSDVIAIDVDESLVATVHGSGDLVYTGSPTVVKQVKGSGSVQKHKS